MVAGSTPQIGVKEAHATNGYGVYAMKEFGTA